MLFEDQGFRLSGDKLREDRNGLRYCGKIGHDCVIEKRYVGMRIPRDSMDIGGVWSCCRVSLGYRPESCDVEVSLRGYVGVSTLARLNDPYK